MLTLLTSTKLTEDGVSRCSGTGTPIEVKVKDPWGSRSLIREVFVEEMAFEFCGRCSEFRVMIHSKPGYRSQKDLGLDSSSAIRSCVCPWESYLTFLTLVLFLYKIG